MPMCAIKPSISCEMASALYGLEPKLKAEIATAQAQTFV